MVTLAGDVVAAGVRANKFQRVYETVAEMLAASDTIADGEIVQAAHYFYEGAGSATDHHVTNAGGSKLYCIATPYVTPEQFGAPASGDCTTYVQAAIDSGKPVFLLRMYDVTFVHMRAGQRLIMHGAGKKVAGLNGTSASAEAVFQTSEPGNTATSEGSDFRNLQIRGTAKRGFVVTQWLTSICENVYVAGTFTKAIVMECSFGNIFNGLETGGGADIDLQIGATVLDTIFNLFYTNNSSAHYHVVIDDFSQEIADWLAPGHRVITFNTATFQGADCYAVKIIGGTTDIRFHNTYFEANKGAVLILDADDVTFEGCWFDGEDNNHLIWVDQVQGAVTANIAFHGCSSDTATVLGNAQNVTISGCRGVGFQLDQLRKTNATYKLASATLGGSTGLQVNVVGEYNENGGSMIGMRCTGTSNHTNITVASDGTISAATPFALQDVDHLPHGPVIWLSGSGTRNLTSGVAMTPVQFSAAGGTGPYTYALITDAKRWVDGLPTGVSLNTSTGEISGTPTQTGTFRNRFRVTDANGVVDESRSLTIVVT